MTVGGGVDWYFHALLPISIVLAFVFPLVRCVKRCLWTKAIPIFDSHAAVHDFANGLTFPTFVALIFLPMTPESMVLLEHHALQIAGGIGIFHIVREAVG